MGGDPGPHPAWIIPAICAQADRKPALKIYSLAERTRKTLCLELGQPTRGQAHLTCLCSGFRRSIALILSPLRRQRSKMRNSYLAAGFLSMALAMSLPAAAQSSTTNTPEH